MSEKELNSIICKKINYYMDINGTTQMELANYMGVSQATISNWQKGIKTPRMSKIDKICEFFHIQRKFQLKINPLSQKSTLLQHTLRVRNFQKQKWKKLKTLLNL